MKFFPRPLLVFLCVLCLLSAQQGVFVHLLGHLGAVVQTGSHPLVEIQSEDGAEHSKALVLTEVCASCLAFSAVAAGASISAPLTFALVYPHDFARQFQAVSLPIALRAPYAARAPPLKL